MKEKRKSKAINILGFLASVFFAAFILMEFRQDYWAVAGAGIVMLIQAYFLVNKIEEEIYAKHLNNMEEIDEKLQKVNDTIEEKYEKIDQMQKAVYVATKKGTEAIEDKVEDIARQLQKAD
ncbi:MAG: hypothetical protein E7256_08835 [Lachnospiraceae bacterium]|nr:hypothetical protein [Lachnospiraceae bacterium]